MCQLIAKRFQGYSITTVSGRFRALDLMRMKQAATIEENGDRHLIDETTAIVRFTQKPPFGVSARTASCTT